MNNSTSFEATEYEREVCLTIPFYTELHQTALDVVRTVHPSPRRWLDSGCGPGNLAEQVSALFPEIDVVLADPSAAMLDLARDRCSSLRSVSFVNASSAELPSMPPFDVITAVQSHHYGSPKDREMSLRRCRQLLKAGGVLVTFENVRADTDVGHRMQRQRWGAWQCAQGRDASAVEKIMAREGVTMHPITVCEHLELLRSLDFAWVELVWRAYGQAGFVAQTP